MNCDIAILQMSAHSHIPRREEDRRTKLIEVNSKIVPLTIVIRCMITCGNKGGLFIMGLHVIVCGANAP